MWTFYRNLHHNSFISGYVLENIGGLYIFGTTCMSGICLLTIRPYAVPDWEQVLIPKHVGLKQHLHVHWNTMKCVTMCIILLHWFRKNYVMQTCIKPCFIYKQSRCRYTLVNVVSVGVCCTDNLPNWRDLHD